MHLLRGTSVVGSCATLSVLLRAATAPRVYLVNSLAYVPLFSILGGRASAAGETLSTRPRHGWPMLQTVLLGLAAWRATWVMRGQAASAPAALELCLQPLILSLLGRRPREAGDFGARRRAVHRAAPLLK